MLDASWTTKLPAELEPEPELVTLSPHEVEQFARYSRYSIVWAVLWLGGVGSLLALHFGARALTLARGQPSLPKGKAIFGVVMGVVGVIGWLSIWGGVFFSLP